MRRRGNGFAEYIEALWAALGPDPVSFEGRFYKIPTSQIGPKPVQPGEFQVLVGVSDESSASVERAGRTGLGLHPIISDWTCFESQLAAFRAAVAGGAPGPRRRPGQQPLHRDPHRRCRARAVVRIGLPDQRRPAAARRGGVDHVMWDPNGVVPYETQLRLLEPLIAVRPS